MQSPLRDAWRTGPRRDPTAGRPGVESSSGVKVADRLERLVGVAREADAPVLFTRGGLAYHTNAADLEPVEHNGWPLTAGRRDDSDKLPAQYEVLVSIDPSDGRSSAE